jgi:hypothetical protein
LLCDTPRWSGIAKQTPSNGWTPLSDGSLGFSSALRSASHGGKNRIALAATGDYAPSLRSPWRAATEKDKAVIIDFKPQVVVGWFIGGCGIDIFKHTKGEPNEITKSKLYREKIEDIIVSSDVCMVSIEYIHLVNRGGLDARFSEAEIFEETKKDYGTYVFGNIGFEVVEVKNIHWPREGSEFEYGQAHNPNFAGGEVVLTITSILAKRVKQP